MIMYHRTVLSGLLNVLSVVMTICLVRDHHFHPYAECSNATDCLAFQCGSTLCNACSGDHSIPRNACYLIHTGTKVSVCRFDKDCEDYESCLHIPPSSASCVTTSPVQGQQIALPINYPTSAPQIVVQSSTHAPIAVNYIPQTSTFSESSSDIPTPAPIVLYDHLANCVRRKVLIVHLDDKADFSRRMMAIISSAQLAVITSRPLMLQWNAPQGEMQETGQTFEEIFYGKSHSTFVVGNMSYFSALPLKQAGKRCTLDFQNDRDRSTAVLTVQSLFERVQQTCDFLVIKDAGEYFADLLTALDSTKNEARLDTVFTASPLKHITNCVFRFQRRFYHHTKSLVNRLIALGPYLTLHVHSQSATETAIATAFQCINEMLKHKVINIVYLVTEDSLYSDLARRYISDSGQLLLSSENSIHTYGTMDKSAKEIYVTSHSDYCASTSLNSTSPTSQVAMASGPCIYIDVLQGSMCYTLESIEKYSKKKFLLHGRGLPPAFTGKFSQQQLQHFWNGLKKEDVTIPIPCYNSSADSGDVEKFWSSCA